MGPLLIKTNIIDVECSEQGIRQAYNAVRSFINSQDGEHISEIMKNDEDWVFTVLSSVNLVCLQEDGCRSKAVGRICVPHKICEFFLSSTFLKDVCDLLITKCFPFEGISIENETWRRYTEILCKINHSRKIVLEHEFIENSSLFCLIGDMEVAVISLCDMFTKKMESIPYVSIFSKIATISCAYFKCVKFLKEIDSQLIKIPFLADFIKTCYNYLGNLWYVTGLYEVNGLSIDIIGNFRKIHGVLKDICECYSQNKLSWSQEYDPEFFKVLEILSSKSFRNKVSLDIDDILLEEICQVNSSIPCTPNISTHMASFQNTDTTISIVHEEVRNKSEVGEEITNFTDSIIQIGNDIVKTSSRSASRLDINEQLALQENLLSQLATCSVSPPNEQKRIKKRKVEEDDLDESADVDIYVKRARYNSIQALEIQESILFQEREKSEASAFMDIIREGVRVQSCEEEAFRVCVDESVGHMKKAIDIFISIAGTGDMNMKHRLAEEFIKCNEKLPYSETRLSETKCMPCTLYLAKDIVSTCDELDMLRSLFRSVWMEIKLAGSCGITYSPYLLDLMARNKHVTFPPKTILEIKDVIKGMSIPSESYLLKNISAKCKERHKCMMDIRRSIINLMTEYDNLTFNAENGQVWLANAEGLLEKIQSSCVLTRKELSRMTSRMDEDPIETINKMDEDPIETINKMDEDPIETINKMDEDPIETINKMDEDPIETINKMDEDPNETINKNGDLEKFKHVRNSLQEKVSEIETQADILREKINYFICNRLPELESERFLSIITQETSSQVSKVILDDNMFEQTRNRMIEIFYSLRSDVSSKLTSMWKLGHGQWVEKQLGEVLSICKVFAQEPSFKFPINSDFDISTKSVLLAVLHNSYREEVTQIFLSFLKMLTGCSTMEEYKGIPSTGNHVCAVQIAFFLTELNKIRETSVVISLNESNVFQQIVATIQKVGKCESMETSTVLEMQNDQEMPEDEFRSIENNVKTQILEMKQRALSMIKDNSEENQKQFLILEEIFEGSCKEKNLDYLYNLQQETLSKIMYVQNLNKDIISFHMWDSQLSEMRRQISSHICMVPDVKKTFLNELVSLKDDVIRKAESEQKNNLESLNALVTKINKRIYDLIHYNLKSFLNACIDRCLNCLGEVQQENVMNISMDAEDEMIYTPGIDERFSFLWTKFEEALNPITCTEKLTNEMFNDRYNEKRIQEKVREMVVENMLVLYNGTGFLFEKGPVSSAISYSFFRIILGCLLPNCLDNELFKMCQEKERLSKEIIKRLIELRDKIKVYISLSPETSMISSQKENFDMCSKDLYDSILNHMESYSDMNTHHPVFNIKKIYDSVNSYLDRLESISGKLFNVLSKKNVYLHRNVLCEKSLFSIPQDIQCFLKTLEKYMLQASDIVKDCEGIEQDPYKLFSTIRDILVSGKVEVKDKLRRSRCPALDKYENEKLIVPFYEPINKVICHDIPPFFKSILKKANSFISCVTEAMNYLHKTSKQLTDIPLDNFYIGSSIQNNYHLNLQYLKKLCGSRWNLHDSIGNREKLFIIILNSERFFTLQNRALEGNKNIFPESYVFVCNNPMANGVIPGAKLCFNVSHTTVSLFTPLDFKSHVSFHSMFFPQCIYFFNLNFIEDGNLNNICSSPNSFKRKSQLTDQTLKNQLHLREALNAASDGDKKHIIFSLASKDNGLIMGLVLILESFIHIVSSYQPIESIIDMKKKTPFMRALTSLSLNDSNAPTDIIFNPDALSACSYTFKSGFFESDTEQRDANLTSRISRLLHLVQMFILSTPTEINFQSYALITAANDFFCSSNEADLRRTIQLITSILKVYIAYKYTFNLRSIDGYSSAWGPYLSNYNTLVDLNDIEKFSLVTVSGCKSSMLHATDLLFVNFVQMVLRYVKNVEHATDILFRTAGNKHLFFKLPRLIGFFNQKSFEQLALSLKVLVAHNLSCKLAFTDEELLSLWKKYGVRGKKLGEHLKEIYGIECMHGTYIKGSESSLTPVQNENIMSFYMNKEMSDESLSCHQELKIEHHQQTCDSFKYGLFDFLILSVYSGVNFSVCQEITQESESYEKAFIEILNTTYQPNVRHLSNGSHLISDLSKQKKLPLTIENLNEDVIAAMIGTDHNLAQALRFIPISKQHAMLDVKKRIAKSEEILNSFPTIPVFIVNQNMEIQGFAICKQHLEDNIYNCGSLPMKDEHSPSVISMNFPIWKDANSQRQINESISRRIYYLIEHDKTLCIDFFDNPFMPSIESETKQEEMGAIADLPSPLVSFNCDEYSLEDLTDGLEGLVLEQNVLKSVSTRNAAENVQGKNGNCLKKRTTEISKTSSPSNNLKCRYDNVEIKHMDEVNDNHKKCTSQGTKLNCIDTLMKIQGLHKISEQKHKLYINMQKNNLSQVQLTLDGISFELS